jgi:hypothetical protein
MEHLTLQQRVDDIKNIKIVNTRNYKKYELNIRVPRSKICDRF